MTDRERIRSALVDAAADQGIILQLICHARAPGWWVDLTCANVVKDASTRWERFIRTLPTRCAALSYRLSDLRTESKAAVPYATFALVPDANATDIDRIRSAVLN
jgi:hypothetical protein